MAKNRLKYFLLLSLGAMCLILFVNIYVNTYGYYGSKILGEPSLSNARYLKIKHLQELEDKPSAYVLGSSNSMRFLPTTIQSHTGLDAFNLGVFHARTEDYWALSNALVYDLQIRPELVILCLDDWNLADEPPKSDEVFRGANNRLAYKPLLSSHLDDFGLIKLNWNRFKSGLTYEQTKISFGVLLNAALSLNFQRQENYLDRAFEEDGVRKYYADILSGEQISDVAEAGNYEVGAVLLAHDTELRKYSLHPQGMLTSNHENFEAFSERRWDYLYRTLALYDSIGTKVIINLMPTHPFLLEQMTAETNYIERTDQLLVDLTYLQIDSFTNLIHVQDNRFLENFNGKPEHFFDEIHPTSVNSDLMLTEIFKKVVIQ